METAAERVIWAPWRKGYVVGQDREPGCVFCRVARESDDRANLVLVREPGCFLIINRFPYNNGHLMVVPNRHVPDLDQLNEAEAAGLLALARRASRALKQYLKPDGFNLGINIGAAAGAGIAGHIHLHIVPRWFGDTNFMPVTGSVKAIPDSLDALYGELRQILA